MTRAIVLARCAGPACGIPLPAHCRSRCCRSCAALLREQSAGQRRRRQASEIDQITRALKLAARVHRAGKLSAEGLKLSRREAGRLFALFASIEREGASL